MAGPALVAAAWPVSTKMPAPMMQPMPSETRLHAESVRFNGTPPCATKACTSVSSASAWSRAIGFLIRIFGTLSPSPSCSCLRRMVRLSARHGKPARGRLEAQIVGRWRKRITHCSEIDDHPPSRFPARISTARDGMSSSLARDVMLLSFVRSRSIARRSQASSRFSRGAQTDKDKEPNWLPAPKGPFLVAMRLYWPKEAALDGSWKQPPMTNHPKA